MSTEFRTLFLTAALLCLAGCGGGGDGGGPNQNPNPPTSSLITISSANAPTVAGVVAQEALEDDLLGALTTTGLPVGNASTGAATVLSSLAGIPLPAGVAGASIVPQNCAVSGTVDVEIDLSNPATISPNDEFRFQFQACNDGGGAVIDGGLVMTVTAFQGDPLSDQFLLAMSIELSAFTVTQDGNVSSATGTVSIEIDSMPPITTITVSTSALTSTYNGVTETITNLTVTVTEDDSVFPTAVSVETSFRLSSPRLGGDVIVSTSINLQSSGDEFPFSGELRIQAANNSAVVLIALDSNSVRLQIDINGDGATDETVDTTWAELMAAADAA